MLFQWLGERGRHLSTSTCPVLAVYHPAPEGFVDILRAIVPDASLRLCRTPGDAERWLKDVEVLLAFRCKPLPFPREAILSAPCLRWVQLGGAGADHLVPFDAARLTVTNAAGLQASSVAEYVLMALLHLRWDVFRMLRQQRECRWEPYSVPLLDGATLGVVGAGRIGREIARRGRGLGMATIGVRRSARPLAEFDTIYDPGGIRALLSDSDAVVISAPLTSETRGLIGRGELSCMRPHAHLIVASRAGIVDEGALTVALSTGAIAGAAIDVFENEPLPADSRLWSLPNVLATPHISGQNGPREVARFFCENWVRWTKGDTLRNVIDPILGY